MDSEKILLDMFKKQHYDESRHNMQKIILFLSGGASLCGAVLMTIFFAGAVYLYMLLVSVGLAGIALIVGRKNASTLNWASFFYILFVAMVLVPVLWHFTGIEGSAPYISLVILVSILSMFSGKMLHVSLSAYLTVLLALMVYSVAIEVPLRRDHAHMFYTLIAYLIAVGLITTYILSKLKRFEELNDRFLRSSFKDELTHVYNRRLLDIIIQYEEVQYNKQKQDYLLMMLDIDQFKNMNDSRGHIFGDIVLRNVAKCINDKVRDNDFVVRYGGDEFLVVQTSATEYSLQALVDRMNEAIEASCYMDISISVSYGYAARSECKNPGEVLALADKRLYEMKKEKGQDSR